MLEFTTAKIVKEAIDKFYDGKSPLTLEDVFMMQPIPKSNADGGYTVIATQCGNITVLAHLLFDEENGVHVREVQMVAW